MMGFRKRSTPRPANHQTQSFTKLAVIEIIMSVVMITVMTAVLLWNWDGFWQTEVPLLKNSQQQYFPTKYRAEQRKLANQSAVEQDLVELLSRVIELERENALLQRALEEAKPPAESAAADWEIAPPDAEGQEKDTQEVPPPEPIPSEPASPATEAAKSD